MRHFGAQFSLDRFIMPFVLTLACLTIGICAMTATGQQPFPEPSFFGFLVTGKNPPKATKEEIQTYQRAHIDNFKRLFELRKLATAGPMADPDKTKRGILVLTARTKEEIPPLFVSDPYVSKGFMELQLHPIKVEFGRINTEGIDPSGIEENRIVIFTAPKDARLDRGAIAKQREYVRAGSQSAGLAFYAASTDESEIRAIALFLGKNDDAIQRWADASPLASSGVKPVKMPQWLGKGILVVPSSK
jgi:uncharacterized protein YciI